ncbi:MAG: site-specific integrase [Roseiarcus sp.]
MSERANITLTTIKKLPPESLVWDAKVRGFGARRQKGSDVSYVLFYRTVDGRQRWATIGKHGSPWTPDTARAEALIVLAKVKAGGDPAGEKAADRKAATVAELCDAYLDAASTGRLLTKRKIAKKPSTLATDKGAIERHIKPLIGALKVAAVNRRDIENFQNGVAEGKTAARIKTGKHGLARVTGGTGAATRIMGLLGAIFGFAVKCDLRPDNPCRGVQRHADGQRTRRASEAEYAALGKALRTMPKTVWPIAVAATRFLAVTGWRRGEMLALRWTEVDLATRTARLDDTKTGASMRPLSHAACDVLRSLPRIGALVFPSGRGEDEPMAGFHKVWLRIAKHAALAADVTPHILRHSFASVAHDLGYSELTIASLLGHRKASVTAKYAHAADAVLLAAADAVARSIEGRLGFAQPEGVVVEADFTARRA